MSTFADDLEAEASKFGEKIENVVIGPMGWGDYGNDERHAGAIARQNEVLSWDDAKPLLDYTYDRGYGAPDCQAVYAYTASWVLFVSQYDGSTSIYAIPLTPRADVTPQMPGG